MSDAPAEIAKMVLRTAIDYGSGFAGVQIPLGAPPVRVDPGSMDLLAWSCRHLGSAGEDAQVVEESPRIRGDIGFCKIDEFHPPDLDHLLEVGSQKATHLSGFEDG